MENQKIKLSCTGAYHWICFDIINSMNASTCFSPFQLHIECDDEPPLRLIGKQAIFAISELNSSAMAWSIDTILFAICSIYFLLRSRRVSLRSSDSFNGDLRNKSFYILSTSSLQILVISSSISSILSLSCSRISILRFNTFPGASRAILTFHFQYLLYFTL